ncbi:Two component regulator propeller [Reichenbachiella faecimaris]|uniref:histidine kinase n=1 Tax=Reichenbachiella faecimaris TaxID=692418 RepID=A0A1W2GNM9_REIFA|nr:sensor histidine kinase [Reichenbachiella faecimaris]SMD38263.1 Two component regulator propeller [Reichenbachiella faecimaris]
MQSKKGMRSLVCLLLFTCSGITWLCAQSPAFDPKKSLEDISISQWTTNQGLPSNNTNAVYQDSNGLIWIASNNGFMIYDGERIETYDKNRLSFLENDGFYAITENHEGTIFIASKGDGLVQYKNGIFNLYEPVGISMPKSIRSIYVSSDSSLYLGANYQGFYQVKNDTIIKLTDELFDKSIIRSIIEDADKNIWFGTEDSGLHKLLADDVLSFDVAKGLVSNNVRCLSVSEGKLYIGTSRGLQWMDQDLSFNEVLPLKNTTVNTLIIDAWNMIWVGSENGLGRWNKSNNRLEWLSTKHDVDLVRVTSMIMDEEHQIWISSNRSGLVQIRESKVSNLARPTLSSDRINIIHESWNGNLYIGTDANRVDVFDGEEYSVMPIKTNLNGNGVRDIFHDRDGSFWLATYIGVIHINKGREILYSTASGMPADNFRVILKDQSGNFWFGTRSGGLVKFKGGKIERVYANGSGLESNFVFSIAESKQGEIYVGTFGGGLTIIMQDGSTRTHHLGKDDSGLLFFNVDFDSLQHAFITTNNGLLYFENDSLQEVKLQSDQRSNTFFDLVIDNQKHLWLTTNLGVLQIKKSDWRRFQNKEINEIPYFTIDQSSGMNSEECTGATRSNKISNGNIYVPTLGGVVIINPKTFKRDNYIPRVSIRQMIVDDQAININNQVVECTPGTSRYRFDFSVLSFTSPDRNQFKYKLEGYDNDWSGATYDGSVEYTNLSPGDYTFRVIGTNDGYVWNTEGDALSFSVLPFYYETIWFIVLCVVLVGLVIFLFFRWRVAFINNQNLELRKVNAELDRFVYSASHEMRSPLSSILGLINVATLDKSPNKEEYLNYIKLSVQRLDSLLRDIVDHSKNARLEIEVEPIDVKVQVEEILQDISFLDNYSKIKHNIECLVESSFHSDSKRLKIVLSNLITNAFKHHSPDESDNPFVNIRMERTEDGLRIKISDNGPGIEEEEQGKIFNMFYRATHKSEGTGLGLYLVKEIVENLKGTIEVESVVGKGTAFVIELPDLRDKIS